MASCYTLFLSIVEVPLQDIAAIFLQFGHCYNIYDPEYLPHSRQLVSSYKHRKDTKMEVLHIA